MQFTLEDHLSVASRADGKFDVAVGNRPPCVIDLKRFTNPSLAELRASAIYESDFDSASPKNNADAQEHHYSDEAGQN